MQKTSVPQRREHPEASRFAHVMDRLFRRKPVDELVNETKRPGQSLKKALSAFDLVAFGIGAIIGSGIFALTGTAISGQVAIAKSWASTPVINFILGSPIGREGAGPAIVISFLIAGLTCLFAALCYAELAASIPVAGSAYTFSYASLGQLVAWIIGWDLVLEYAVGAIAVSIGWSGYFLHFLHGISGLQLPLWLTCDTTTALSRIASMTAQQSQLYSSLALPVVFGHPIAINIPAVAIMAVITSVLVIGIRESAAVNGIMVIIKVAIVAFFVAVGSLFVHPSNWIPFAPSGLAGIMGGAALVFFAFIGFDAVSATAEEARNPERDLPIGIMGSLAICSVLYIAVSLVLTGILPYQKYLGDPAAVATALAATGQPLAHIIVTIGALVGMTSVLLVLLLGQSRIFMAMARDGLLPQSFAKLHPRFQTPYIPTIITGVLVGIFALCLDIGQAAELTNIGTLSAFILVCAGVIVLRKLEPDRPRPFHCPWVPVVPILGIVACLALMISLPIVTWLRFIVWMALGMAIYFSYGYRESQRRK